MWQEKEISIGEIKDLLDEYEIEVESPDGWVPVNFFVDKGMWDEYIVTTDNGFTVICNENHLFKTTAIGWLTAREIENYNYYNHTNIYLETIKGPSKCVVSHSNKQVPIIDINVNHQNHRYYTNGIESHNTGVGKSLFMCHCAAAALAAGQNVLYITLEMAEEKIAERIVANLLDVTIEDLYMLSADVFAKKHKAFRDKTPGRLIIKEYPTASAGAANFRHLLNELRIKKNFKPDVIFIDYLNICSSSRIKQSANVNSYTYIKAIAEELRGLAVEFNVPIMSATQTNRTGYSNSDVDLTDTSESFGLPATADFMFALIQTDELKALNQMLIKQLKNRFSDPERMKRFVIGVDKSKMRLYNLDTSAQSDIMDEPTAAYTSSPPPSFNKDKFKDFK